MEEANSEKINNLKKYIESLLFISGEPLSIKMLAQILEEKEEEIKNALESLKKDYLTQNRGLTLIENENFYQLTTHPSSSSVVSKYLKEVLKEELTPASLETLAIVAYKGPISRPEIDNIRGVNSSFILRSLLIRGLLNREADPKRPNTYLYRPSFELIRKLGLESVEQLPDYEKFHSL